MDAVGAGGNASFESCSAFAKNSSKNSRESLRTVLEMRMEESLDCFDLRDAVRWRRMAVLESNSLEDWDSVEMVDEDEDAGSLGGGGMACCGGVAMGYGNVGIWIGAVSANNCLWKGRGAESRCAGNSLGLSSTIST